jgi:hypothetical protein
MDWDLVRAIGLLTIILGGPPAALWGAWWLWWRLPKRQIERLSLKIRDAKARADVEDNFRKTISQLLGAGTVLVGAGFAYFQLSQQQRASHDLLISNQVSKGFEQLGSDKVVVRLGGIYALEGVMNGSEQYHQPVLEALCAFVRDGTKGVGDVPPTTEIQAALTVIGRRSLASETDVVDLSYAHIHGANLKSANLANANLTQADLGGANLFGAYLSDAQLGQALLHGADVEDADLHNAYLTGADLSGANLSHANLSHAFLVNTNLSGANLSNANLSDATMPFQSQLGQACGTDAKLPPDMTLKPCGSPK